MSGWQRLKIVLSVIWWAMAAFLAWLVGYNTMTGETDWPMAWFVLGFAAVLYVIAAALWWALAGFRRQS